MLFFSHILVPIFQAQIAPHESSQRDPGNNFDDELVSAGMSIFQIQAK